MTNDVEQPDANTQRIAALRDRISDIVLSSKEFMTSVDVEFLRDSFGNLSDSALEELGLFEKSLTRRYSVTEAVELLGISRTTLYDYEEKGRLPAPDMTTNSSGRPMRQGFTVAQLQNMRAVFDKHPKFYQKLRKIVGVLNQKGGSQKTSTALHVAQRAALQGYRVLILDTDAQGSASIMMGKRPDLDVYYEHTIAPFLLQDDDYPELLDDASGCVQNTYWPNIDIIPGCSELLTIDVQREMADVAHEVYQERTNETLPAKTMLLRRGLEKLLDDYDLIIVDGTPSLNLSTLNVISACDYVLVPTPAQMIDFSSTVAFLDMFAQILESFLENDIHSQVPEIGFVITKYQHSESSQAMEQVIRSLFGERVHASPIKASEEARKWGNQFRTVYEVANKQTNNAKGLKNAVENYSEVFDELMLRLTSMPQSSASSLLDLLKKVKVKGGEAA